MLTTLATVTLIAIAASAAFSNPKESVTEEKANCFAEAEERTRKSLIGIYSREQLNRYLEYNFLDPKDYEDMNIDRVKEKLCQKARQRGSAYSAPF